MSENICYHPGDIVPDSVITKQGADLFFECETLPDSIFAMMQGKSYKADCPIAREDLRYLKCLHRDAEGQAHVGEMVLSTTIADRVLSILRLLYDAAYPIERMRLVDYYEADDETSMTANNSSAFNFRFVSHTHTISKHGLGLAVDINPLYNPYHKYLANGRESIEPAASAPYLDRSRKFTYKIERDDLCCRLFRANGFEWGGDWTSCKDYQHFELK